MLRSSVAHGRRVSPVHRRLTESIEHVIEAYPPYRSQCCVRESPVTSDMGHRVETKITSSSEESLVVERHFLTQVQGSRLLGAHASTTPALTSSASYVIPDVLDAKI